MAAKGARFQARERPRSQSGVQGQGSLGGGRSRRSRPPLSESSEFQVPPTQISQWKRQAQEG